MNDQGLSGMRDGVLLPAVTAAPFPFAARITPRHASRPERRVELTGRDPAMGANVTHSFELAGQEQGEYLDLFEKVAKEYGTRLPRNRSSAPPPSFAAS